MRLGWLDPSVDGKNTGDQIIAAAVDSTLRALADMDPIRLPTKRTFTRAEMSAARSCSHFVVGGSNLLNGNYSAYRQWKLNLRSVHALRKKTVLLGVGWWQYEKGVHVSSRLLWKSLLDARGPHSVRDGYTQRMLRSFGVESLNTSCVTLWDVPPSLSLGERSHCVVTTLTDYNRVVDRDRAMMRSLGEIYDRVLFWPQGSDDLAYLRELGAVVEVIGGDLASFDDVIRGGVDYFGTRLHAGIRALQWGGRSTIVAVDNRATEIGRETGLAVVPREAVDSALVHASAARVTQDLVLPLHAIGAWKRAFQQWLL